MNALILARGGSKGVPRKNIKLLDGNPLIFYPIDAARKSKLIKKIYVSTDDDEIALISEDLGAEIIHRPKELASDNSTDLQVFNHFYGISSCFNPIVHLRATTPILDPNVIDEAINTYLQNEEKITSLRSAHEMSESAFKCFVRGEFFWEPIIKNISVDNPRQIYPKTYTPNGYVDIIKYGDWISNGSLYGDRIYPFITKFSPEIDTIEDFEYVEYLIKKKNV